MTYRTYNIELQLSTDTAAHWMNLLIQTRDAYNLCAEIAVRDNIPLSVKSYHNALYDIIRKQFPMIPAQGAIKTYKAVLSTLRSIKRNKHKDSKTPQRNHLAINLDKRMYSGLNSNGIFIASNEPYKREHATFKIYPFVREMFEKYPTSDPLIFARNGKLYLSVPFEVQTPPLKSEQSIGVDLGMKRLYVTSEGNYFSDKQYLAKRRRVRFLKRKLSEKGTHSAKRHLRKLSKNELRISKDMQHRAAKTLVESTDASIIVLEDLKKLKKNTSRNENGYKCKRHNNAISQVPFYSFKQILTHKAQLAGKQVETVSPTYTSQTDSRTNKRDGSRQGCRYICKDGLVLDADWNAAVNIALRANHPTSNPLPIDGGLKSLVGRVKSATQSSATHSCMASPLA